MNASDYCGLWDRFSKVIEFQKYILSKVGFNPIQDGGPKGPPTSFSPETPTKERISPPNFLTFSFDPFPTMV